MSIPQAKPLTEKQLETLGNFGYTKKELKSLATIKTKNFWLKDGDNPGNLLRLNEDGNIISPPHTNQIDHWCNDGRDEPPWGDYND